MFGATTRRITLGGGRPRTAHARRRTPRGALLLVATLTVAPGAQAQTLDEWILRFGEAAAQQSSTGRTGSGGSGTPTGVPATAATAPAAAPATTAPASATPARAPTPPRACGAALAPGELVLRGGASDDCGIRQLTTAVRDATQAMNDRRPVREAARDGARDGARDAGCDGEESCRRNARTERLKEVSSLKHEEDQMARSHNAPRNVTIPPAKKGGNWTWQTYQLGR